MHRTLKVSLFSCIVFAVVGCGESPKPKQTAEPATVPAQIQPNTLFSYAGIFPGATAAQAKDAGFTICETINTDKVVCRKEKPLADFKNVAVTKASIVFSKPFEKVDAIDLAIISKRPQPKCKKVSDKSTWSDLETCDGPTPKVYDDLTESLGQPQRPSIKYPSWTDCDLYTIDFDKRDKAVRIKIAKTDSEQLGNKIICKNFAEAQQQKADQQTQSEKTSDFIKSMSSTTKK